MRLIPYTIVIFLVLSLIQFSFSAPNIQYQELVLRAEENTIYYVETKSLAINQDLPVSIYLPEGILIHALGIEDGRVVYGIVSNLAQPFAEAETAFFEDIAEKFDLSVARIYYGNRITANETLGIPVEKATFQGSLLLIPESTNDRIMAFDPVTGDLVDMDFIPSSTGPLSTPIAAQQTPWGTITVSDQVTDLVQEFDTSGVYLNILAPAGGVNNAILDNLRGHAFQANGNLLVTVASGTNSNAIAEFDQAGNYLGNFIANGAGGLNSPWDILFRTSDILVTGGSSNAVHRYDLNGTYLNNLVSSGISFPEQITELQNGNLALAAFSSSSGIYIYSSTGTLISYFASVSGPRGVFELGNGNLLVTSGTGVFEIDGTAGTLIRTIVPGVSARFIKPYEETSQPVSKLLISEFVVTPTNGEFIEIFNPNNVEVVLSDIYLTDATFAGGQTYYYNIVTGTNAGGGNNADFHARFPDGATIQPGEYQTVAMNGTDFVTTYAVQPTYELFETDPTIPDMREAFTGSINNQGGLTNSDEVIILYHWDGLTDLVGDLDYVLYNNASPVPNNELVDKTGIRRDGPDPDTDSTAYLNDTADTLQVSAPSHGGGFSVQRIDLTEGAQTPTGGNGVSGADETSEDLNNTFAADQAPTPNAPYPTPALNPPQNLTATAGPGFVDLSWEPPLPSGGTELAYDDGTAEGNLSIGSTAEGDLAVRFTPNAYPATLLLIKVFFAEATGAMTSIDWTVSDGSSAGPGTSLGIGTQAINRGAFDLIDISGSNIQIAANDFFISYFEPNGQTMNLSWDTDAPSADRSWVNAPGLGITWQTLAQTGIAGFDNDLMIRAIVQEGSGENARIVELGPSGESIPLNIRELKSLMHKQGLRGFNKPTGDVYLDGTLSSGSMSNTPVNYSEFYMTYMQNYIDALTGFNIYRSEDGTSFNNIGNVDSLTFAYTDATVMMGNTYWYYVTAVYTEGESGSSDTVQVTIPSITEQMANHETPRYRSAITNEGTIGMLNIIGGLPGFEWPLNVNQLYEGAVMVGIAPDQVSDGARVISAGGQQLADQDFLFTAPIDTIWSDADSTIYETSYDDSRITLAPLADDGPNTPLPVEITQTSYSYTDAANSGYLILELEVTNTGANALNGLLIGLYFDWDVNSYTTNTGEIYFQDIVVNGVNGGIAFPAEFAYIIDNNNPNPFLGMVPLSQNVFRASRVADNNQEIFPGGASPFSEANKYNYMLNRRTNNPYGDPFGPDDKSLVAGLGGGTAGMEPDPGFTLNPGENTTVGFAIVGGNDLTEFVTNGTAAMQKWVDMGHNLVVLTSPVGISGSTDLIPTEYALHQNFPNPFNPTTTIKYDLKQTTDVSLKIFNLLGQQVRTLVNASEEAGYKSVNWDGLNNAGDRVASGIYIYRLEAGEFIQSKKMILMK